MKRWRVIDTGYLDCYSNMAIDEALLKEYDLVSGIPALRIYGWNPQALSIGYSQDPRKELDIDKCRAEGIDFVRRMTGGGVIFHKNELTYSIVCKEEDLDFSAFSKEIYRTLCSFIVRAYQELGLKSEYALQETTKRPNGWFCFTERERYDILVNKKKIGGNAQKRKRGTIFQHGSIPIQSDLAQALPLLLNPPIIDKIRVTSLSEALNRDISYNELKSLLIESFRLTFNVGISVYGLSKREKELSVRLLNEKYKKEEWNLHRDVGSSKAKVA